MQCNREASMILSIRLHTLEVTLSSMTLRVLNLVQLRNWTLLGSSLNRGLQKLSWRISCMQFGILIYPFTVLADLASSRYCIPMDSPRPILSAELEFFNKGTGRGKSQWIHTCWFWRLLPLSIVPFHWPSCCQIYCMLSYSVLTHKHFLHSSTGGYIHQIWWSNNQWVCKIGWCRGWR